MKPLFFVLALAFFTAMVQAENSGVLFREGTYEVPTKNPDLSSAASFPLKKMRLVQNGTHVNLTYVIPVELTGEKNLMQFDGELNAGQGQLGYGDSKMNCLADQTTLMCKVTYQGLKFDQNKAEKILSRKFSGDELLKRMSIQKDFSTDPVGVIKVKLQ